MGCAYSVPAEKKDKKKKMKKKKKVNIPEIAVFVPSMRVPFQSDLQTPLDGIVPEHLVQKLHFLRNQIPLLAVDHNHHHDRSKTSELHRNLEEYLSILIGLMQKELGLEELVQFKWKNLDGYQEAAISSLWFELISVIHMMAMASLLEANSVMIPKDHSGSEVRTVSTDCKREAVDLLLKASGYIQFCIKEISIRIPPENKKLLPMDLHQGMLEAISIQALGQGTEIQLGLAVESQKASLPVKRRLACELFTYFSKAHIVLSECNLTNGYGKKQLWFIRWKLLEAKAAAYYFHGLIMDKGNEASNHISAVCCFRTAEEMLAQSKKACLTFCVADPVSRVPPYWGAMRYLNQKIPEVASRKSETFGYLVEEEKALQTPPILPEFSLSLNPEDYILPEMDSTWGGSSEEHLNIEFTI